MLLNENWVIGEIKRKFKSSWKLEKDDNTTYETYGLHQSNVKEELHSNLYLYQETRIASDK